MTVVVPTAALPLAYATTAESDHDVLRALMDLPVIVGDQLDEADAPGLGAILTDAVDPTALGADALAVACVVHSARRRGWPVLTANPATLQTLGPDIDIEELP